MTLSTRIGVMDAGEIVQVGEPAMIYEYPNSRFVADFIGSVNLFEGRIVEDEPEHISIAAPDLEGTIYVGHGMSCTLDQQVCYALRPEKLRVSRDRPEQGTNVFRAMVEEVAYMGNLSVMRLRLGSGKVVKVTRPNLERYDPDAISWDEEVWLHWDDTAGVVLTQ